VFKDSSGCLVTDNSLITEQMGFHNFECESVHEPALNVSKNWMLHEIMTQAMYSINLI
jgi:hypothetical protein